ncbi:hypothetical protein MTO96_020785 [Rhipicephalus appendiculatus]
MIVAKSFSCYSINCLTPCTSSDGQLCHIFRDIAPWNKFLWQVGLQLLEFDPGELSLIDIYDSDVHRGTPQQLREASTLLQHLLTLHHCVVSVDLNSCMLAPHYELICDTLRKSPSLKKLKLRLRSLENHVARKLAATLAHMSYLRELDCGHVNYDCIFLKVPFAVPSKHRTSLRCLFKAVASHTSLKKVILTRFRDEDVAEICKALRDTRVQERCFVGVHLVSQNTVEALTVCKELSSIIVDSSQFRNFDTATHYRSPATIVQSCDVGLCFDEAETQILADTLQSSRTLCEVSFFPDNHESTVLLIQKLSPNVSSNYTLLQLRLSRYVQIGDDWFTVADVVSRNISLVMRAAHFVTGTKAQILRSSCRSGAHQSRTG